MVFESILSVYKLIILETLFLSVRFCSIGLQTTDMKDFFISYNKADLAWAEWIAWQLEDANYSVVLQAWDFRPGGNFVFDMQKAMAESERTIAVLSPDYLASLFTAPEWAAAFKQDPTGEKGLLLPVRVQNCEPRGVLPQIVYIDLLNVDEPKAKELLLTGIRRNRAKPARPPIFPSTRTIIEPPSFPSALPAYGHVPSTLVSTLSDGYVTALQIPINAPTLPIRYFPRNQDIEKLCDELIKTKELISDIPESSTVIIGSVGMGGVGKTVLATAIAWNNNIRCHFTDGIFWVNVGKNQDLLSCQNTLVQNAVKFFCVEDSQFNIEDSHDTAFLISISYL